MVLPGQSAEAHENEVAAGPSRTAMIHGLFQGTEMPDADWWHTLFADPAHVLTVAGLIPGVSAVDLCAGDGWFTLPMARIASRVVAVDIDPALLDRARMRLSDAGLTNCVFKVADAFDLPKQIVEPVDFVFLANVFHGVPDQTKLSCTVAAVLAPAGRFAIVNWHRRPREETVVLGQPRGPKAELRMSPEMVNAVVEPSGLKLLYVTDVPPYHYASVFEKVSP
jgi:ubiquinone/menaquinone biosynthesis C-methylase UbiE